MTKFKPGDRVKKIKGALSPYTGTVVESTAAGTYLRVLRDGVDPREIINGFSNGADANDYQLIEDGSEKTSSLGTNPKDLIGSKKVPLHSVPPASLIYQALGMSDGRVKYGDYNWRKNKVIASIYIDATLRHLASWLDGEENAEDSKKPHLGHALANIGIIVDALETGNLVDDRPTPGTASRLLAKWEIKKDEKKESA